MARTSDPIDAVGAVVREALTNAPNIRHPRFSAAPSALDSFGSAQPPRAGVVEIQLTVKLSDFIAALTPSEAAAAKPGGPVGISFAVGFTDDDGNLVNADDVPAYIEATGLARTGPTKTQGRALVNRIAGRGFGDDTGLV